MTQRLKMNTISLIILRTNQHFCQAKIHFVVSSEKKKKISMIIYMNLMYTECG